MNDKLLGKFCLVSSNNLKSLGFEANFLFVLRSLLSITSQMFSTRLTPGNWLSLVRFSFYAVHLKPILGLLSRVTKGPIFYKLIVFFNYFEKIESHLSCIGDIHLSVSITFHKLTHHCSRMLSTSSQKSFLVWLLAAIFSYQIPDDRLSRPTLDYCQNQQQNWTHQKKITVSENASSHFIISLFQSFLHLILAGLNRGCLLLSSD